MNPKKILLISAIVLCVISIGVYIPGLVIGSINFNDSCGNSYIPLSRWLIITGSIGSATCIISFVLFGFIVWNYDNDTVVLSLGCFKITFLILQSLFFIAWSIVGALSLFQDGMKCQNSNSVLWGTTLANLIMMWLSIASVCCGK